MSVPTRVTEEFRRRFRRTATLLVRAPGRVNLIGEHTDYNDGFVMPLAIDRAIWIALRPNGHARVTAHSLDFDEPANFSLDGGLTRGSTWAEYLKGVAEMLKRADHELRGWEGVIGGDVPIGAGLSSSAALEVATARAFAAVSELPWDPVAMAKLAQRSENEWVGVNCGIMDQMISAAGAADHALLIDCRSLAFKPVPLPPETSVVILDTATRRGLVDSVYNERRSQCEAAARHFGVGALRDVSVQQFQDRAEQLDEVTRRRARHVITENDRTCRAAEAMRRGDAEAMGKLMNASHESLRDDYEVSSEQLNTMVRCARATRGCYGARMTGAGFGGCAVALVRSDAVSRFTASVAERYQAATGLEPRVYVTKATDGAALVVDAGR